MPLTGLLLTVLVEWNWFVRNHGAAQAPWILAWFLLFFATYAIFPFIRARNFRKHGAVWAAAALSVHFISF